MVKLLAVTGLLEKLGDADSASTIPSVVHHLAVGAAEQVRAGLQSAARIEAFNPSDQPEVSLLE